MSSNVQVNQPSTSGAIIAADEITSVQHQLVKLEYGDAGSATQVSSSNPLPTADGTLAAKDFATQTTLAAVLAKLSSDPATQTTLAAILAKIISAPATEAKQDIILTGLAALLTELQSKTEPADQQHTIVDSSALPALAATSTKQDAQTALLTTIDGDTSNLDVALSTRLKAADTLAGVTTVAAVTQLTNALPAGTNAIGKLAVNSGVDIGDVDVTSVVPGTGATNLGKAEDSQHSTGDVGVMALTVRNDSGAVLAENDNDYVPMTTDATGALRVDMNGTASTNNASTTPLAAAATFTGTAEDVLNYNEIRVTVYSDVASGVDGFSMQQSTDNSNWVVTDNYTIAAATGKTFSVPRQARYFRIVYTNGGRDQSTFILQTILNRVGAKSSSQRPSDNYTNQTDLEQQQAFLMNYNGTTDAWCRLRGDSTNGILVNPNGFNVEYERRMQEQIILEMYEDSNRNFYNTESYTSGRREFELR